MAEKQNAFGNRQLHVASGSPQPERAILVCCDFTAHTKRRPVPPVLRQARAAAELRPSFSLPGIDDDGDEFAEGSVFQQRQSSAPIDLTSDGDEFAAQVDEFRELAASAGAVVIDVIIQRRERPDSATLVGKGKVVEIAALAESSNADFVVFQSDLTPSQLRELESALPCRVIDRTQLILDIFAAHARTREGQLQVELAQLEYLLPRLSGQGRAMSQLGGGIGTRGPGETQLETDKRKIGRSVLQLKKRLEAVRQTRRQQRQRRSSVPMPTIALVGYTNAGKSTLFNALTQADVVASSRMFATLDPTLRPLRLPSRRRVLLSDTVGFIRALPPTLINAFRATLEEVQEAELLIHVMDATNPSLTMHREEVEKVLLDLGVQDKPCIHVMNKVDMLDAPDQVVFLANTDAFAVSAKDGTGLQYLLEQIDRTLTSAPSASDPLEERVFLIPQSEGGILAALEADGQTTSKEFTDNHVRLRVRGPGSLLNRYREFWV